MRIAILLFIITLSFPTVTNAQSAEEDIKAVIVKLFDGMRAGDSSAVASAFTKDAVMQTIQQNREGEIVKVEGSLQRFLMSVGTPREEILDEKISGYTIQIDGDLAHAWTPYQFYVGENFSHCGVNSFQLARLEGQWKIIYIVDTRRRTDCIE